MSAACCALAAAQAGDEGLLDNFLYKIALDRASRAVLASGVRALAAALAAQEIQLPMAGVRQRRVVAPALAVPHTHGWALDKVTITWPDGPTR